MKKPEIKIETTYKGGKLKGRIVYAESGYITVVLDKPCKGKSDINFGFASAMKGRYVFDKRGNISKAGMEGAKEALTWAYQKAETKRIEKKFKVSEKDNEFGYDDFIKGMKFAENYYEKNK